MDWIKRRPSSASSSADELAMAKAAAWAWYQHGSGCDGRAARESDLGRRRGAGSPRRQRRPSRYKLEALGAAAEEEPGSAVPLLDVYEVERITRELERLIATSDDGGDRQGRRRRRSEESAARATEGRRAARRAWVRHAVGLCGAGGEAVQTAAAAAEQVRGKAATVVWTVECREKPRTGENN